MLIDVRTGVPPFVPSSIVDWRSRRSLSIVIVIVIVISISISIDGHQCGFHCGFIAIYVRNNCDNHDETRLASINGESQMMIVIMIMIMIRRLRTLCAFLSSLLLSQEVVDFQRSQLIASQHIERSINIACPRSQSDTTIDRSIVRSLGFSCPIEGVKRKLS